MALGTGVHNLSLVVRAHNRASRALASVGRDLTLLDRTRRIVQSGFVAMGAVGLAAIKGMAVGIALAVGGSIFAFSKFDDALTASLAITETVSPAIRKSLQDTAREVAKTTIFSANEAAGAYFNLLSAGQSVEQAMVSLPVVAQFAQAGLFDLEVATELLVTAQNALALTFDDPIKNMEQMTRVADVLAAADERAVGSIQDFAEALTNRAAASMRAYNIDVEEGVAVLAAWATQGLKGRTAGQAFSIVVRDLQRAALKEADAFKAVGVAVFDSEENFRNMADIVGDLEDAMEGLTDAGKKQLLQELGFQERSQQRILQLLGTSDAIRTFEADFREAGGTVERVSEKQMGSATKQMGLLKSAIIDVFIGVGGKFDEGFKSIIGRVREWVNDVGPKLVKQVEKVIDKFNELSGPARTILRHFQRMFEVGEKLAGRGLGGLNEKLAILIGWIDKAIVFWVELNRPIKESVGEWVKLIPIIILISGGLKLVGIFMALIASPALLTAAAIAGLIILFKHLWENSQTFRDIIGEIVDFWHNIAIPLLKQGWEIVQEAARAFVQWFIDVAVPFIKEAWEIIKVAGAVFVDWLKDDAVPFIIEAWEQISDTFVAAWEFIQALFLVAVDILKIAWDLFGEFLWDIIVVAWELIKDVFIGAFEIIEGIFQVFTAIFTGDWAKAWEGILSILKGAWRIIWGVIKAAWGILKSAFKLGIKLLVTLWTNFWDALTGLASGAWNIFTGWFGRVWDSFKEFWNKGWEQLRDAVTGIMDTVGNAVRGPFNAIIGLTERLVNIAIDGLNSLIGLANRIPGVNISIVGKISLPRLALGADVIREGLALVGESGPELVRLGRGAQVAPLGSIGLGGGEAGLSPTIQIEQVVFQGTPEQMLEDWKRHTKLALRGA